jgi:tRNA (guanine37-N1)-methyltransferase
MWFGVVSLFPEMFAAMHVGVTGKAIERNLAKIMLYNPRDWASDKSRSVDDKPFGGGPGMLMKAEPVMKAVAAAKKDAPPGAKVIYLSPQGRVFQQKDAKTMSASPGLILIAGRYEGLDQRAIDAVVDDEYSLGDYILTGGELAAMAMMDATIRLLEGTVGDQASVATDSLSGGLLKYPQYTRPDSLPDSLGSAKVPEVLLSGHHQAITRWREKQSLGVTLKKRPDLAERYSMSELQKELLEEYLKENDEEQET